MAELLKAIGFDLHVTGIAESISLTGTKTIFDDKSAVAAMPGRFPPRIKIAMTTKDVPGRGDE